MGGKPIRDFICPKCGQQFHGVPALSRDDNKTLICSDCGTREALASIGIDAVEREQIIQIIHKYCS